MRSQNKQWVPINCGILVPNWRKQQYEASSLSKISHQLRTRSEWREHWYALEQPWRIEPEIDQERQRFLWQHLKDQKGLWHDSSPFKEIALTRADIEWLIDQDEHDVEEGNIAEQLQ